MATILEQTAIRERARGMSVAAYHRLIEMGEIDGRYELIEGFVVEKMSKSPLHRFVVRALVRLLEAHLKTGMLVFKEEPLTLDTSEPEPDVAVVEGDETDFAMSHPTTARLVAEVAISSLGVDNVKASGYARANIEEYWVLRPRDGVIDVHRDPADANYRTTVSVTVEEILESTAIPGFALKLAELLPESELQ